MKPAARVTDMHVCPMVTGVVPHVGGPILPPGAPQVLIGGMPAARVSDMCVCTGPPDVIILGSFTVLIGGMPAARLGDSTAHGGVIVVGCPTVLIGEGGAGAGGVTTGLGADVDAVVAKSPTLTANIDELKKAGWTIEYGEAGKGSFADRTKKTIVVDPNEKDSPATVTQTLAHESGHALYEKDPYVPPDGLTKEQYVEANTKRDLKDEGEATLTNVQVRNEINENGGPDIGIAGTQTEEYEAIAAKYPEAKDRDTARGEIGDVFAKGEKTSTTGQTYEEYYSKTYSDHYDETVAPAKEP